VAVIGASLSRWLVRSPAPTTRTRTPLAMAVRRFLHQPGGVLGLAILLTAVLLAALAPLVAPYSPIQQFPGSELSPPSARFPFGTDSIGRDLLSRIIFGTRVSLLVGVIAVALGAGLGGTGGLVAGYSGGVAGAVIMRLSDAVFAVPAVLLGIAFAAAFGASAATVAVTLGIATMPTFARLTRAAVFAERSKEYILAARTVGATPPRLIARHILPNILGPLLVQARVDHGRRRAARSRPELPRPGHPAATTVLGGHAVRKPAVPASSAVVRRVSRPRCHPARARPELVLRRPARRARPALWRMRGAKRRNAGGAAGPRGSHWSISLNGQLADRLMDAPTQSRRNRVPPFWANQCLALTSRSNLWA